MDRRRIGLLAFIACSQSPSHPAPAPPSGTPVHLPPIAVTPYPEPPEQQAVWTPPPGAIDAKLVAAAKRLFDQGLADPRGCDYREIELEVGDGWQDELKPIKTHGWVLPAPASTFAIAWNGLVYRTRSIGAPASVTGDARAMLDAETAARALARRDNPSFDSFHFPVAAEGYYVAIETMTPNKAIMLLRLGEGALAERVWNAATSHEEPYAALADDWLWSQYMRGVGAHVRGDVALAIESWRRLPALAAAARIEVAGSGIIAGDQGVPYLREIAVLLADEQRRAAHPEPPLDLDALAARPQPERIARLVAALDQIATRPMGTDPIVQALIKEGEPAIEPLIAAYETDDRRTRARFVDIKGGDNDRSREVYAVYEMAYRALTGIVDLSFFPPATAGQATSARTPDARRAVGTQLRAYVAKWHAVTPAARQYAMLADDQLDGEQWLTAAYQLTRPTAQGVLSGEALRTKAAPSVTQLFVRRLPAFDDLRQRARLLEAFAVWDPAAARPHLAKTVRDAFAAWQPVDQNANDPYLGEALAGLTTARISSGDAAALADYAGWLVTTKLRDAQFAALGWLRPMIAHPDAPEIVRAATALFIAQWVPLLAKDNGYFALDLIGSDLLKVDAFRQHVLAQLANHAKLGTVRVWHGGTDLQTDGYQEGQRIDDKDPLAPRDGTTYVLRVADQYAASLSSRDGAPKFRIYWPLTDRDRAIAAQVAWLRVQQ